MNMANLNSFFYKLKIQAKNSNKNTLKPLKCKLKTLP